MGGQTISDKSVRRVLASGVFDVLHPGHLHYLREAKRHGNHLVVVVTSDGHAAQTKRVPRHTESERAEVLAALSVVDEVIIGHDPYDLVATTRAADPQVIALGHDQPFEPAILRDQLEAAGITVAVVRIGRLESAA